MVHSRIDAKAAIVTDDEGRDRADVLHAVLEALAGAVIAFRMITAGMTIFGWIIESIEWHMAICRMNIVQTSKWILAVLRFERITEMTVPRPYHCAACEFHQRL